MKTHRPPHSRHRAAGFSLLEAVVTVAILSTISAVAFFVTTNVFQNSRATKLTAQVASLNQALKVYAANGGNLATIGTAQTALDRLKTTSSNGAVIAGLRGSMIDQRLLAIERSTGVGSRAYWDNAQKRFALKDEGSGIFEFAFSDSEGAKDFGSEERDANLKLAEQDNWVWDYEDFDRGAGGPGGFPLDPSGSGSGGPPPGGGGTGAPVRLQAPLFNLASGGYDEETLATLSLSQANTPGSGTIHYSLDSGSNWTEYTGTIEVPSWPATIVAYSDSLDDSRWLDSDVTVETYDVAPPPTIAFYTTVELIDY